MLPIFVVAFDGEIDINAVWVEELHQHESNDGRKSAHSSSCIAQGRPKSKLASRSIMTSDLTFISSV